MTIKKTLLTVMAIATVATTAGCGGGSKKLAAIGDNEYLECDSDSCIIKTDNDKDPGEYYWETVLKADRENASSEEERDKIDKLLNSFLGTGTREYEDGKCTYTKSYDSAIAKELGYTVINDTLTGELQ